MVRIDGPTCWGAFFIRDSHCNVWDGKRWRGAGMAWFSKDFKEAWAEAERAKRKVKPGPISRRVTDAELYGVIA